MLTMSLSAEEVEKHRRAKRMLLWFGIISITMLFAGLTSAYIVRQGEGKWVQFALPDLFKVSTVLIFISSFSMQWAVMAARKGNKQMLVLALGITALLGCG